MHELTVAILGHAVLGAALAVAVWVVGIGCVRGLRGEEPLAYAFGLLVLSAAAFLLVASAWLAPVAIALVCVPLLRARASLETLRSAARTVAWSLLAALGLGLVLGLLDHGPTETEDSSAYGDMLFYAAKTVAASESLFPFHDLTVEGQSHVWVESAWTFLSAPLSWLPAVDVVLLQAATAPVFLLVAVAIGVGLLRPQGFGSAWSPVAAVLAVSLVAYPSWLTESPPVAVALPLAFPLYALWRGHPPARWFVATVTVTGADLFLTKGMALIPFAVVSAVVLFRDHAYRARRSLVAALALAVVLALVFARTSSWLTDVLALRFLPADAADGLVDQLDSRDTQAAAPAFLVAGEVLLLIALLRARAFTFAAALAASVVGSWIIAGHSLDIAVGLSVLLSVLLFVDRVELLERDRVLVGTAALSLVLAAWFRDIAGARAGFLLVALLTAGLVAAFVARPLPVAAAATLVGLGIGLGLGGRQTTLTRADYDLWRSVAHRVAGDSLVFTSETGPEVTGTQGWNYYPGIAGRQIYLAGWSNSPLLVDRSLRERRLALNRAVLAGRLPPSAAELSGDYGAYYAVLRRDEAAPPSFRPVYRNERFVLYRIED